MMKCAHPDGCLNHATGIYRLFPTNQTRALCDPCFQRLSAVGLHLIKVETGWLARAIEHQLPPRVSA